MPARATLQLVDGRAVADAQLAEQLGWLGAGELARYQRFARPERQRQFLMGRVLARRLLGELLGEPPNTLQIEDRQGQAPVLTGPGRSTISFSISHSGPWVACAVSADSALGLDIEQLDARRDISALAQHAFSAERCAWLVARPDETRLRDFYILWSAQEARIKLGVEAATTIELSHPELSIILCSAAPLSRSDLNFTQSGSDLYSDPRGT
ncbi:MAG: 4'-phosphopantetheinyl transferase superfamily protein [Pseudomonadota bacterium]